MDCCFHHKAVSKGITVLVVKETKTKAISTFIVPTKSANEYLVKAVVDSLSGCGCGRDTLRNCGELATVAFQVQETVKHSRQSDTILENSPKGDSQSNGAAEKEVRKAEGMICTWKMKS